MMTKHTPGKWLFTYRDGDKSSSIISRDKRSNIVKEICIIPHDGMTESGEIELLANARLIAAAPLMLDALKAIYSDGHVVSVMSDNQLKIVKEAIAAAEGETP
jgi:hypothetical protein